MIGYDREFIRTGATYRKMDNSGLAVPFSDFQLSELFSFLSITISRLTQNKVGKKTAPSSTTIGDVSQGG